MQEKLLTLYQMMQNLINLGLISKYLVGKLLTFPDSLRFM